METLTQTRREAPILQSGDRLTRTEFERRYAAAPANVHAELIEGIVYMLTSVRIHSHGNPHSLVITWLGLYAAETPGAIVADNTTVRLDNDNEPQPDAMLIIDPARGGQAIIGEDDYVEGAPELVVEIAASSASYDLHVKKNAYRRNGVREYIVWQIHENRVDWFVLEDEQYISLDPDAKGLLRSRVFPGLHLDVEALRKRDLSTVLECARNGVTSEEHAAFVARLADFSKR